VRRPAAVEIEFAVLLIAVLFGFAQGFATLIDYLAEL
jgi:hypothetical protein